MPGGKIEITVEVPRETFPEMMVIPADRVEALYEALKASLGK